MIARLVTRIDGEDEEFLSTDGWDIQISNDTHNGGYCVWKTPRNIFVDSSCVVLIEYETYRPQEA